MIGCEHETVINVQTNHVDMVKFSSPTDYRYIQIKNEMESVFHRLAKRKAFANGMRDAL
jgi:hypothetical protein